VAKRTPADDLFDSAPEAYSDSVFNAAAAESSAQKPIQHTTPTGPREPLGRSLLRHGLDALPTVGGVAGGLLGGGGGTVFGMGVGGVPGAVGGAALGGAGGEALRQLGYRAAGIEGAPDTPEQAVQRMTVEAALQGGGELGGQGLMALGKAAAPSLMKTALRYPLTKAIRKSFPTVDVAAEALQRGVSSEAGAVAGRKASAAESASLVEQASQHAGNIHPSQTPDDVRWIIQQRGGLAYSPKNFVGTTQVNALVGDLFAHSSAPAATKAEVRAYLRQWAADNAHRITPEDWYAAAQGLQQEARATYAAAGKGRAGQALDSPVVAEAKQKLASAIKRRLGKDIEGLAASDRSTQVGMAMEEAFNRSEHLRGSLLGQALPYVAGAGAALGVGSHAPAMALPGALATIGATNSILHPTNLAKLGLLARPLASEAGQQAIRYGSRSPLLIYDQVNRGGTR